MVGNLGAFTFVLHSHLPYVRLAGRWPHGEEWIHEAACETYIPLLALMENLRADGVPFRLTIGITPTLAEQLADPLVLDHLDQYIEERIAAAERDRAEFDSPSSYNEHLRSLAEGYLESYRGVRDFFHQQLGRDIIGAFRRLQDAGLIEIVASAATHGYLPLLSRDSTLRAQIGIGIQTYRRLFGREPRSFWLPECGYRPAYLTEDGTPRQGLEAFLQAYGIQCFFSETHSITGGTPVGVATGDVVGPYSEIKRRYVLPVAHSREVGRPATTYLPYHVADSRVSVIGRDHKVGQQVWSSDWGYPGDFDYREFHRQNGASGLKYWRITGKPVDLSQKDYYRPDWAYCKVEQHAEHFAHLVGDRLRKLHKETGDYGIISAAFDTELFGHWWAEGIQWLGETLRHLAANPEIELTTASDYLEAHPPVSSLNLPESSWGAGGAHFIWENNDTQWMWKPIHETELRMERLAARFDAPNDAERLTLNQAAREALLMQSSDWSFLVTTGQAREYAIQRFNQHFERFDKLASKLEAGEADAALAQEFFEQDNLFPDINYRDFAT